ncbi:MAG: pyruvate kinase [Phycisphaerae bacterium]|nr:pyruvate kinase [Phycisphaerae bacterium]
MTIRTRILATVGPATASRKTLHDMFEAGCDAVRINFSHGDEQQREGFLADIRAVEQQRGEPIAVCGDLCGPKIRVGQIHGGAVLLAEGQELVIQREPVEGDATRISTTLGELVDDVTAGEPILLDDGKLRLEVVETRPPEEILCRVVVGGILADGKGVNLPGTQLKLSALTEKDRKDVAWIAQHDFDYVALSFVQRAEDVEALRAILREHNCDAQIIAKIEKPKALDQLDAILHAADAVMVARGDLGVEMDFPAVPVAQKRIALRARQLGKPCIIATQMLESMIQCPTPTRAEVSDVANAVLDHADAVMLSGETSVGKYPVQAVQAMNRTVQAIQAYDDQTHGTAIVTYEASPTMAAIARAVRTILEAEDIAAIAVFTATGATARMIAKNRPTCPILALTPELRAARRTCLYYGVQAVVPRADHAPEHTREILTMASDIAQQKGLAKRGDRIIVVSGRPLLGPDRTNSLVIHTVGEIFS